MRILVVDDDPVALKLTAHYLKTFGHQAVMAMDGLNALEILLNDEIDLIITDWRMPKLNGLELCRRLRAENFPRYIYCILLTANQDKNSLVEGMDAGADDFIVKPFNIQELRVRVNAGKRIIELKEQIGLRNKSLQESNLKLTDANEKLFKAYDTMRTELETAALIQKSLLPEPARFGKLHLEWLFLPSHYLAGDMLGYFPLNQNHIAFYHLDVAGHGTASALQSLRVTTLLGVLRQEMAGFSDTAFSNNQIKPPNQVVYELNQRLCVDDNPDLYLTLLYGYVDLSTGLVSCTQAGHPPPVWLQKSRQRIATVGAGGFPVGMLDDVEYDVLTLQLEEGDRLFIYSDGVTECRNQDKEFFSGQRLSEFLQENAEQSLQTTISGLGDRLKTWKGDKEFEDDITVLSLEWTSGEWTSGEWTSERKNGTQ